MNWDALAAIAELLGAVAVLATLIYLARQIRQNTMSVRSGTYQNAITAISVATAVAGEDNEIARIVRVGMTGDYDSLTDDEQFRFELYMARVFRNFENFHYQFRTKTMEAGMWEGMKDSIVWYYHLPNVNQWWQTRRSTYSREFAAFLESQSKPTGAEYESRKL